MKRLSYYAVAIDDDGGVSDGDWWSASTSADQLFRDRLLADMKTLQFNPAPYPHDLLVGGGDTVIHNTLHNLYSNTVVCMLVRTSADQNTSGRTRAITIGERRQVDVAFGADPLHRVRACVRLSGGRPRLTDALWSHLSPWGRLARQAADDEPSLVVGWLWRGSERELGVWHSEYTCLMNGRHENYEFTTAAANDPTADEKGGFSGKGAALRRSDYCLWCQEIVTARILEKTGRLASDDDPDDINERGERWYERWVNDWRGLYWAYFDLDEQIASREADYRSLEFKTRDGERGRLWESDLYRPFDAQ